MSLVRMLGQENDLEEEQRLFQMCQLCFSLAMQSASKERRDLLMRKHARYAHQHRRIAARMRSTDG